MKTAILSGERYFGVEVTADGKLVVAERGDGRPLLTKEFPADATGMAAFRAHLERECAHPHVFIKACGAIALGLATSLIPVPGVEVTLVSAKAPEQNAVQLARLAERLF